MALSNKKLSMTAETVIDGNKVVTFGAVLDLHTGDLNMYERRIDQEAAKYNRDIVRYDRKEFEDLAYEIQDDINRMLLSDINDKCGEEDPAEETA